jgi:hypothetical protein
LPEFRSFYGRETRKPTAAEARRQREIEEQGLTDVYVPVEKAPDGFWEALIQATRWVVISEPAFAGRRGVRWWDELRWHEGWPEIDDRLIGHAFDQLVRFGKTSFLRSMVNDRVRLSAVELLLDTAGDTDQFHDLANEAAQRFRVGLRLEGNRFIDITSEHVHQEVVRPALQLLAKPGFESVNELYRKGFDRLLAGDPAGAITAATSAVEEMLRTGGCSGSTLLQLAQKARARGWVTPGVEQSIVKLGAYRSDSDAHRVGTDERELARLVLHLTASLLLYLGRTRGDVG